MSAETWCAPCGAGRFDGRQAGASRQQANASDKCIRSGGRSRGESARQLMVFLSTIVRIKSERTPRVPSMTPIGRGYIDFRVTAIVSQSLPHLTAIQLPRLNFARLTHHFLEGVGLRIHSLRSCRFLSRKFTWITPSTLSISSLVTIVVHHRARCS